MTAATIAPSLDEGIDHESTPPCQVNNSPPCGLPSVHRVIFACTGGCTMFLRIFICQPCHTKAVRGQAWCLGCHSTVRITGYC